MRKNALVYITNNYPLGGTTEEAFMKSEISILSRSFSKVSVVPMRRGEECLDISFWPENVALDTRLADMRRELGKLRYICLLHPYMFLAVIYNISVLKNRYLLNYLIQCFQEGQALKQYCKLYVKSEVTFYTFWFAEASIGLGMLPKKKVLRWVSRAHRYDLYDECVPIRSGFFREMAFRNLDKVLACSHRGAEYLAGHFPKWKDKIDSLYLGTAQPAQISDYCPEQSAVRLITVARIEPVKRHLLTFSILNEFAQRYPSLKFIWTVVGGGSLEGQLRAAVAAGASDNLEVEMLGETPNAEVHRILGSQSFDWMIMLSESEGLPISFAEAMSYGIPVIATKVGGVEEEVVSGVSGVLLSSEPSADELQHMLCPYLFDNEFYLQLRQKTLSFWKANFDETDLKQTLADILLDDEFNYDNNTRI